MAFQKLGTRISESLLGTGTYAQSMMDFNDEVDDERAAESWSRQAERRTANAGRILDNVLLQLEGISKAIAAGDDDKARRYLRELVAAQVERSESEHAVKSLCNIAHTAAAMERFDFERECLAAALQLQPDDVRSLTQFADHEKRQGRYASAEEYLNKAIPLASGYDLTVAESLRADVLASQRRYDDANSAYRQIPGWQQDPLIRNAIADNLRFTGDLVSARQMLEELLQEDPGLIRPCFSLAELDKLDGQLEKSLDRYRRISQRTELDIKSRRVCSVALADVLKRMGRFQEAYQIVDNVVKDTPFDLGARIQRGAILGLLNKTSDGLAELSNNEVGDPVAFNDWRKFYLQGLLLLQSGRHEEARRSLIARWTAAENAGEPDENLRLASAVAFLARNEPSEARRALSHRQVEVDSYLRYVRLILELHVAIEMKDKDEEQQCIESLQGIVESQPLFRAVLTRLRNNDREAAIELEIRLLLMAA